MAKQDLPNKFDALGVPVANENFLQEQAQYELLYSKATRSSTGQVTFPTTSNGTYSTADYPLDINVNNKGELGMMNLLATYVLNNYMIKATEFDAKFDKTGGAVTGAITLPSAPTADLHASTKKYVDDGILYNSLLSYIPFCAGIGLDAAFGKNNENMIHSIGEQLAMYGWFNGLNKVEYPFTSLKTKDTLAEILSDSVTKESVFYNATLAHLISRSDYALKLFAPSTNPLVIYHAGDEKLSITNGYSFSTYDAAWGGGTKNNGKLEVSVGDANVSSYWAAYTTTLKGWHNFNRIKINVTNMDRGYNSIGYGSLVLNGTIRYAQFTNTGSMTFALPSNCPLVNGGTIGIASNNRGSIKVDHIEVWYE